MIGKNLEEKTRREHLRRELQISVPLAILGAVGGFVSSYVCPQAVYAVIKDTRELFQKKFKDVPITAFSTYAAFYGIYLYQVQRFASNIINEREEFTSYIPLATNLIGGFGIRAHLEYRKMEELTNGKH